jgi:hypothetical protein
VVLSGPGTIAVESMFFNRPVIHLGFNPSEDPNDLRLYKKLFYTDHYRHIMKHNGSFFAQTTVELISSNNTAFQDNQVKTQ